MPLNSDIKFQKTLALAASASNQFEAEAAELAARRLMAIHHIDPTDIPNVSLYNHMNFAGNALLKKLRDEWREEHPVVADVIPTDITYSELESTPKIPFNVDGFSRHANRQRKRQKKRNLPREDLEKIRVLFNEGWELSEVAELTGIKADTINSVRAWRIVSGQWIRDSDGKFQWAVTAPSVYPSDASVTGQ